MTFQKPDLPIANTSEVAKALECIFSNIFGETDTWTGFCVAALKLDCYRYSDIVIDSTLS